MPPFVFNLLVFLHTTARLRITTAHGLMQPVYMARGVRQGNPGSHLLYALPLGPLFRAQGHCLCLAGEAETALIGAHDDVLLVAHNL